MEKGGSVLLRVEVLLEDLDGGTSLAPLLEKHAFQLASPMPI